ncbi:hypothetical protein AB0C34_06985 [Nocardia sp. NPDC049220]|uniref:RskA family anti-sigma factor n=1 Tax=Nocardia sp. NPDC049220 TaxID=3155273 RepID=UPI0033C69E1E
MTESVRPHVDLLDLAYPYAMDAMADIERRSIENRVAKSDSMTAAAFAATVRRVEETLAALTVIDAVNPPPTLESKILRRLDQSTCHTGSDQRVRTVGRMPRLSRLVLAAAVIGAAGAVAITEWIRR